jgi:hypothetical protein
MSAQLTIKIPVWLDRICACPVTAYRKFKYGYTFRRIPLGEGYWTFVDPDIYYRLSGFNWTIYGNGQKFYATRFIDAGPGKTKPLRIHREIMNAPPGVLVDHRDGNTLDNRRANLRLATHSQNSCNRRKRKNTSSRFIGVYFDKYRQCWGACIRYHGKNIWLGRFDSEIDAALAYDAAARIYHGQFARLNFPEKSSSPQRHKVANFFNFIFSFFSFIFSVPSLPLQVVGRGVTSRFDRLTVLSEVEGVVNKSPTFLIDY